MSFGRLSFLYHKVKAGKKSKLEKLYATKIFLQWHSTYAVRSVATRKFSVCFWKWKTNIHWKLPAPQPLSNNKWKRKSYPENLWRHPWLILLGYAMDHGRIRHIKWTASASDFPIAVVTDFLRHIDRSLRYMNFVLKFRWSWTFAVTNRAI